MKLIYTVLLLLTAVLTVSANVYLAHQVVNGIPVAVREYWMRRAMQVQIDTQGTPCPFGAFGAVIVDHSPFRDNPAANPNGTLVCINDSVVPTFTTLYHGETTAILRCAQVFQDLYGSPRAVTSPSRIA